MSITTEQSVILANIAIDEYVAACRANNDAQTLDFLSTLYVLVAERMKDLSISAAPTPPAQPQDCDHVWVHASVVSNEGTKDHPIRCMRCGATKNDAPAQPAERKPLTLDQLSDICPGTVHCAWSDFVSIARAIETAHGIKGES